MSQDDRRKYPNSRSCCGNWRQPIRNAGIEGFRENRPPNIRTQRPFPGQFTRIDLEAKFFNNENVEGIKLLTDFDMARELQVRIGQFANGPTDFFPAMWPVSLLKEHMHSLEMQPYVMGPRPVGPRFLLYVDPSGTVFLENMTQNIFLVDDRFEVKMFSCDGRPITDVVLDGIVTRTKPNNVSAFSGDPEAAGQLTFVIIDAIRCSGRDLTTFNILQRLSIVKEEISELRKNASSDRTRSDNHQEVFTLDIVEIKDTSSAEEFFSPRFKEVFKYPLRSFIFFPRQKGYVCGTCFDVYRWSESDNQECSFHLKIPKGNKQSNEGELLAAGSYRKELICGTITLTEEIRKWDDKIIDCEYIDHNWVFVKGRNDRTHPNGRKAIYAKLAALENPISRHLLLTTLDKSKGRD